MGKTPKPVDDDRQHKIELAKLEVDRIRALADLQRTSTEQARASTDRIRRADARRAVPVRRTGRETTTMVGTYETVTMTRKARTLNPHEEDLLNASLIQLKRAIGFR